MKKLLLLSLCFVVAACDNGGFIGKCLPNERTITTTEENGQVVEVSKTHLLLCGCFDNNQFDNNQSEVPNFMISKEEFSFESELESNKICDKQCSKLCKKHDVVR